MSASANNVSLLLSGESSYAETPDQTATFLRYPFTGDSVRGVKEVARSETITPDRTAGDSLVVNKTADGTTEHEFNLVNFPSLEQATLQGPELSTTIVSEAGTYDSTAQTFTATSGTPFSVFTTGWQPRYLRFANSTGNEGVFRVVSITSTVITVAPGSFTVDETSTATISFRRTGNGNTQSSYLMEKQWGDINVKHHFTGMSIVGAGLQIQARQPITISFDWVGSKFTSGFGGTQSASAGDGSPTEPTAASILTASNNVATLLRDGAAIGACVKSLDITVNNNLRDEACVGQQNSVASPVNGEFTVEGSMALLFEDSDLVETFDAHTTFELAIPMSDPEGNNEVWVMPRVTLDELDVPTEGRNTSVIQTFSFSTTKGRVANSLFQLVIERFPV